MIKKEILLIITLLLLVSCVVEVSPKSNTENYDSPIPTTVSEEPKSGQADTAKADTVTIGKVKQIKPGELRGSVNTKDYTLILIMEQSYDYCDHTYDYERLGWCSGTKRFDILRFSFYLKPKKEISGGPGGKASSVFNEEGKKIELFSSSWGGGFDWRDGWSSSFIYPTDKFKTDLPKTNKLIVVYDTYTNMVEIFNSLEKISNHPHRFIIDYTEIESLLGK